MPAAADLRVVVVEDDADVRDLVRIALDAEGGFAVEECARSRDAVATVESSRPDLVVLDVMMPEVDGMTVARMLRQGDATRDVPLVFLTACLRPGDIDGYVALGARDVIGKPFDPRKLGARLRAAATAGVDEDEAATSRAGMERGYRSELDDRVRDIERTLSQVKALDAVLAREAALLAHRLAGSAAVFGMSEVSAAARALEDALGRFLIEDADAFRVTLARHVDGLRRSAATAQQTA
jgi:two-component system, OmpR family, response regulator